MFMNKMLINIEVDSSTLHKHNTYMVFLEIGHNLRYLQFNSNQLLI